MPIAIVRVFLIQSTLERIELFFRTVSTPLETSNSLLSGNKSSLQMTTKLLNFPSRVQDTTGRVVIAVHNLREISISRRALAPVDHRLVSPEPTRFWTTLERSSYVKPWLAPCQKLENARKV